MAESDVRALAPGSGGAVARTPGEGDGEDPAGVEDGARGGRWLEWLGLPVTLLAATIAALGVASAVGPGFRSALLIEVETVPREDLSFRDSPDEAGRFFATRDTVMVVVPSDMSVAQFLALYHLETNASARAALREQLGARDDADLLREGDEVTFTLTLPRPGGP